MIEIAAQRANQVTDRLAVGVRGALVRVSGEHRLERRRRRDSWRAQIQLLHPRRFLHPHVSEPEAVGEDGSELLDLTRRQPFPFQAPAPEIAPCRWP